MTIPSPLYQSLAQQRGELVYFRNSLSVGIGVLGGDGYVTIIPKALLDQGADCNLIRKSFARVLGFHTVEVQCSIKLADGSIITSCDRTAHPVTLIIAPCGQDPVPITAHFFVVPDSSVSFDALISRNVTTSINGHDKSIGFPITGGPAFYYTPVPSCRGDEVILPLDRASDLLDRPQHKPELGIMHLRVLYEPVKDTPVLSAALHMLDTSCSMLSAHFSASRSGEYTPSITHFTDTASDVSSDHVSTWFDDFLPPLQSFALPLLASRHRSTATVSHNRSLLPLSINSTYPSSSLHDCHVVDMSNIVSQSSQASAQPTFSVLSLANNAFNLMFEIEDKPPTLPHTPSVTFPNMVIVQPPMDTPIVFQELQLTPVSQPSPAGSVSAIIAPQVHFQQQYTISKPVPITHSDFCPPGLPPSSSSIQSASLQPPLVVEQLSATTRHREHDSVVPLLLGHPPPCNEPPPAPSFPFLFPAPHIATLLEPKTAPAYAFTQSSHLQQQCTAPKPASTAYRKAHLPEQPPSLSPTSSAASVLQLDEAPLREVDTYTQQSGTPSHRLIGRPPPRIKSPPAQRPLPPPSSQQSAFQPPRQTDTAWTEPFSKVNPRRSDIAAWFDAYLPPPASSSCNLPVFAKPSSMVC
jgi:hypothetical protein